MPPKEPPTLRDLCLRSIAINVVSHGETFKLSRTNHDAYAKTSDNYEVFRYLFSNRILTEIKIYYRHHGDHHERSFRTAAIFFTLGMFYEDTYSKSVATLCACLLFNEYTTRILLQLPRKNNISKRYIEFLTPCENLKSLTLHSCKFYEHWLTMKLDRWKTLRVLDLLYSSCNDFLITRALIGCPQLVTLKASGKYVTNICLFNLCQQTCNRRRGNQYFELCRLNGMCCTAGKNLKMLSLGRTNITGLGVACALQHLPLLKFFVDGGLKKTDKNYHFLAEGIRILRRNLELMNQPLPILKLEILIQDDYGPIESDLCPNYNTLASCKPFNVWYFYKNVNADTYSVYGISNPFDLFINLIDIISGFSVKPIECFFTEGRRFRISDEPRIGANAQPPHWVSDIKEIHLCDVFCIHESVLSYFTRILSQARQVKSLTVSRRIASEGFVTAMGTNRFTHLEEVSIRDADLYGITLNNLINRDSKLKKITLLGCQGVNAFTRRHKDFARARNFHLDIIKNEEKATHFSIIKTHMMHIS